MKRAWSLRARLVGLTLLAVASVWLLTALATWYETRQELEGLLGNPPGISAERHGKEHDSEEHEERGAGDIAGNLLKPMLFALPALGVVLVIAIGFALRPLRQLAREIATRAPDRLDPLPVESLPGEVVPLVTRLNSLFANIMRALENERRFTADAAHELRTPLAALKAQAQVARASVDASEKQHALEQILVGCDRATHLVTQLLTLARLDADTPRTMQDIALRPIAEEVLAMSAGDAIEHHCELVLRDGDAHVRGDSVLLQVLLRNLVDNALRHGGATQIEVAITHHGAQALLTVSDNGRGIATDERSRVQQRFYRSTSADFPGSGLGLSIVGRVVELHGGTLDIAFPVSGTGVSVRIHLPRVMP